MIKNLYLLFQIMDSIWYIIALIEMKKLNHNHKDSTVVIQNKSWDKVKDLLTVFLILKHTSKAFQARPCFVYILKITAVYWSLISSSDSQVKLNDPFWLNYLRLKWSKKVRQFIKLILILKTILIFNFFCFNTRFWDIVFSTDYSLKLDLNERAIKGEFVKNLWKKVNWI